MPLSNANLSEGFFSDFFLFFLPGVKLPPIFPLNAHPAGVPLPLSVLVRKSDEFPDDTSIRSPHPIGSLVIFSISYLYWLSIFIS